MSQNLFGTDGIRSFIGLSPFNQEAIVQLGQAIGQWIEQRYGRHATLLLAHDTRMSCSFIKAGMKTGLLTQSIQLYDAGILPTPAVYQLVTQQNKYTCSLVISASHNPYYDNGIKLFTAQGKLANEDEVAISTLFLKPRYTPINYLDLGTDHYLSTATDHYHAILSSFFDANMLSGITIILDCAHGAGYASPLLLKQFGATVIAINNEPNGININHECGSTHPETLQKAVLAYHADIGFAFDGDADRLIVVNRHGIVKDGDDILALLLTHPHYAMQEQVVGTIMSNQGLATALQQQGKKLLRAQVGDKYVAQLLLKENILVGGEPSGHIMVGDYGYTSDALFVALRVVQTIKLTNNWDIVTFNKMPQATLTIKIQEKKDLTEEPFATIIKEHEDLLKTGRLVVRYSGTENALRIMAEAEQLESAQQVITTLAEQLKNLLTNKGIFYEKSHKSLVQNS